MKVTPNEIHRDQELMNNLYSIGISIDEYENHYQSMKIPMSMDLNADTIDLLLSSNDFTPFLHLYTQLEIRRGVADMVSADKLEKVLVGNVYHYKSTHANEPSSNIQWTSARTTSISGMFR